MDYKYFKKGDGYYKLEVSEDGETKGVVSFPDGDNGVEVSYEEFFDYASKFKAISEDKKAKQDKNAKAVLKKFEKMGITRDDLRAVKRHL